MDVGNEVGDDDDDDDDTELRSVRVVTDAVRVEAVVNVEREVDGCGGAGRQS